MDSINIDLNLECQFGHKSTLGSIPADKLTHNSSLFPKLLIKIISPNNKAKKWDLMHNACWFLNCDTYTQRSQHSHIHNHIYKWLHARNDHAEPDAREHSMYPTETFSRGENLSLWLIRWLYVTHALCHHKIKCKSFVRKLPEW